MTLQEIKNHRSQNFPMELKISIARVTNSGIRTVSPNFTLNEFVNNKSTILNC